MTQEDKIIIIEYFKHTKLIFLGLFIWLFCSAIIYQSFNKSKKLKFVVSLKQGVSESFFRKIPNNNIQLPVEFLLVLKDSLNISQDLDCDIESLESSLSVKELNMNEWVISFKTTKGIIEKNAIQDIISVLNKHISNKIEEAIENDKKRQSIGDETILMSSILSKIVLTENESFIQLLYVYKTKGEYFLAVFSYYLMSLLIYLSIVLSGIYFFKIRKIHLDFMKLWKESK